LDTVFFTCHKFDAKMARGHLSRDTIGIKQIVQRKVSEMSSLLFMAAKVHR